MSVLLVMDIAKEQESKERREILDSQLRMYIDVYKHHFDLFLKGIVLYLAAVGAIASYIYREGLTNNMRAMLSILVAGGSLVASIGCFVSWRWVKGIEERVARLSRRLEVDSFPFNGPKGIALVMAAVSALLCAAGFATLFFLR